MAYDNINEAINQYYKEALLDREIIRKTQLIKSSFDIIPLYALPNVAIKVWILPEDHLLPV